MAGRVGPVCGAGMGRAMGDKIESKQLAMDAKVNVIPGDDRILENIDEVFPCFVGSLQGLA